MIKQSVAVLGVALGAIFLSPVAHAAPLMATFADVVEPDAELTTFLKTLVETAKAGIGTESRAYAVLDEMIAPKVQGFSRGLDPLEKWNKIDLSNEDATGVDLLTGHMVETGDLPEDAPPDIDYRQNFLELLVALVGNPNEPLGTMPEMGKAICSPARYSFDAKAALKFAEAHDTDAYGLYIYPTELQLHDKPKSGTPVTAKVAPRTLIATHYQADQPDNWTRVITSEGTTGWIEDHGDYEGLSQQHLCFGKVDGQYKITGFYTYGL